MSLVRHRLNIQQKLRMDRENWMFATMLMVSGLAYAVLSHQRNRRKLLSFDLKMVPKLMPKTDSSDIVFIIDAAAGSARQKLSPTLKKVGIYVISGSESLGKIGSDEELQATINQLLMASRTSRENIHNRASVEEEEPAKVAVFISSVVFRALGNKIIKNYPFAKWVFAYGTAAETLSTCSCYAEEVECYPPSTLSLSSLSMRKENSSHFGESADFNKYLNELPKIQQSKMDAWLGAIDLLFTIKNNEDEDNEANKKNIQNSAQHRLNLWFQKDDKKVKGDTVRISEKTTPLTESGNGKSFAEQAFETEKRLAMSMKLSGGHGFAPFTLRMSYLTNRDTRLCTLQQFLQYLIHGVPGNEVNGDKDPSLLKVAYDVLTKELQMRPPSIYHMMFCPRVDLSSSGGGNSRRSVNQTLSDLAFAHKRLLLQDKVILDTILPEKQTNWRLRSRGKKGCGCCAPEDEEEDEDEEGPATTLGSGKPTSASALPARMDMPGGFAMIKKRKPTTVSVTTKA